jgi:hypothetical protein
VALQLTEKGFLLSIARASENAQEHHHASKVQPTNWQVCKLSMLKKPYHVMQIRIAIVGSKQ